MKAEEFEEEAESQIPRFIILCPPNGDEQKQSLESPSLPS